MTVTNRTVNEKCHQLESENRELAEKLKRVVGSNAVAKQLVNELKAEIRKLKEEKQAIEENVAKIKVIAVPCGAWSCGARS